MDDIHARAPVDRVAVWVTGPGEHFDPKKRVQANDSEIETLANELHKEKQNEAV